MSSQLFKVPVPYKVLGDFLDNHCEYEGKFHVFSKVCFRKALYHDRIKSFCQDLSKYYHISKKYYVDRDMNYRRFTTVLRQLCKLHTLPYTSNIVYNKSKYDILYYIDTGMA